MRVSDDSYSCSIAVVARLKNSVTVDQANAELTAASAAFRVRVTPPTVLDGAPSRNPSARRACGSSNPPAFGVACPLLPQPRTLLITCANVSGLLLARGRDPAEGAGDQDGDRIRAPENRPSTPHRKVLCSRRLPACQGAALACPGVSRAFSRYAPAVLWTGHADRGVFELRRSDARALLFALGVTLVTSVLCGLSRLPSIRGARVADASSEAKTSAAEASRAASSDPSWSLRSHWPVLLLAAAALLLETTFPQMQRLQRRTSTPMGC
mgnify:CR=1 FL=1